MWKQNKGRILLTSAVTGLPCLIGLLLWKHLPELIPVHFDFTGTADDWAGRPFAVFALPGFFLACHLICALTLLHDPKAESVGGKMISILIWIIPVVSLVTCTGIYAYALRLPVNIAFFCISLVGAANIVLGNLLPKLRHNYTVGIKTPWTLADPENWYHTHRIAGWSMVVTGVVILATSLCMNVWLMLALLLAALAIPMIYSYAYYLRHRKEQ